MVMILVLFCDLYLDVMGLICPILALTLPCPVPTMALPVLLSPRTDLALPWPSTVTALAYPTLAILVLALPRLRPYPGSSLVLILSDPEMPGITLVLQCSDPDSGFCHCPSHGPVAGDAMALTLSLDPGQAMNLHYP
ncbi:hypothetical protein P7K49_029362 [Saguinus oedipus]|uniref:Uncharacterized protein n=1 Tax=Saguinus oedipus TaxID=9490 RepID=A0ABQ9U6Z4_SAGOE|nr:hypothetical protein P7K49_029362 [Saguinus oedipus]